MLWVVSCKTWRQEKDLELIVQSASQLKMMAQLIWMSSEKKRESKINFTLRNRVLLVIFLIFKASFMVASLQDSGSIESTLFAWTTIKLRKTPSIIANLTETKVGLSHFLPGNALLWTLKPGMLI